MTYDLSYQTRGGRCAWCLGQRPQVESHAVLTVPRAPPLELRFHHECWPQYRAVAEGVAAGSREEWTPPRVEELRITAGMNALEFARALHVNPERLRRYLGGDLTALTPTMRKELAALAARVRFGRAAAPIDWEDPRAFFNLMMHAGWTIATAGRDLGAAASTVKRWLDDGVPRSRAATWARLSRAAQRLGFDAAAVADDRCWTAALLEEAITASGRPVSAWAREAGCTEHSVRNYRTGRDSITRQAAWKLTRAATRLGVALPPPGRVPYVRPPQERHVMRRRRKRWTAEMLAQLGTAPDSVVGERVGKRAAAVAKQRHRLGIPAYQGPP